MADMEINSSFGPNLGHNYKAFGLRLQSCFPLPELPTTTEKDFDVEIKYGMVPAGLAEAVDTGLRYQAAPGRLLLTVDGIARFLISDGRQIIIERQKNGDDGSIGLFLLGPVFNGLLQQREDLVLRGSAIAVDGQSVAFLGPSGVGKSTLAVALLKKGYGFLTDDLCVVRSAPESPRMVQAGFPQAKLWPDSLRKLKFPKDSLKPVREKLQKRILPINFGFINKPLSLKKIYLFSAVATAKIELKPLEGSAAYTVLERRPYLGPFLKGLGLEPIYRQLMLTLTLGIPVTVVHRPRNKFGLAELTDLVEADFLK